MKRLLLLLLVLAMLPFCACAEDFHANWYEVFVRSYQDSDGDGLGDLQGLYQRLDYLTGMGYNGLWLMPVMPSPSYHKYDVTDYLDIDPEYGTLEDMHTLIAACHERDILVILDLPVNHTSTRHPWFQAAVEALKAGDTENPMVSYYHFSPTPQEGYVPLEGTNWYFEERFSGGGMPDLNLDNETVLLEIENILRFWLIDVGADGFRLDAVTSYYTNQVDENVRFLAWLNDTAKAIQPDCVIIGECWAGLDTIARYYDSGADGFFLFPASQAEGFVAASLRGRSGHAEKFAKSYQNVLNAIPAVRLAPFLSNHDTGRTIGSVQGRSNLPIAKFAEAVMNILGGRAFTYYGEEIGMVGSGDDPNKRLAMYWSNEDMTLQPPGTTTVEYAYPSVAEQEADPDSLLNYCRALNHLKLAYPLIATGDTEIVTAEGDFLLLRKSAGEDALLLALNFAAKETLTATVEEPFFLADCLVTGDELPTLAEGALTLPPYSLTILSPAR